MNKATKGTLAIAAGVVLLFGGGGSLAYWSSQATVTPAQVTTGQLTIGTASSSGWSVEKYLGSSFTSVDTASYLAVPGDTLQYAATFPVTAVGTNLKVSAALTGGALTSSSSGLQTLLGATPTYTVKDQSGTTITPSAGSYAIPNGTTSLSVTTTISWPFGSTGDQVGVNSTISLSQIGLTLTQVAP